MLAGDLSEVFFNLNEFGIEVVHKIEDEEDDLIVVIFDVKTEIIVDHEVVGHQPSILVTQDVEEQIKHRSVLVIKGKEYRKSHTDEENADLIRIFLERA